MRWHCGGVRRCFEARNVEYWPQLRSAFLEVPALIFAARSSAATLDIALVCGSRLQPPIPLSPSPARSQFVGRHPSARPETTAATAAATIEEYRHSTLSPKSGVAPASSQARSRASHLGPASTLTVSTNFEPPKLRTVRMTAIRAVLNRTSSDKAAVRGGYGLRDHTALQTPKGVLEGWKTCAYLRDQL